MRHTLVHAFLSASLLWATTAVAALPSSAYNGFTEYIYANSSCGGATDPINVHFEPSIGYYTTALGLINNNPVLGWTNSEGSIHYFYNSLRSSATRCQVQTTQRAGGCIFCVRDHGRLNAGTYVSGKGYVSAFPVHYEVVDEFCGTHSVASFNSARDRLGQKFRSAGYRTTRTWIGNTLGFQQPCGGPIVRSDGYIDRVHT